MSTDNGHAKPEFYRLPTRGVDPYHGFTRSMYYALDASGEVPLVRIHRPGNQRGIVLVSYERMSRYVRKFDSAASAALGVGTT